MLSREKVPEGPSVFHAVRPCQIAEGKKAPTSPSPWTNGFFFFFGLTPLYYISSTVGGLVGLDVKGETKSAHNPPDTPSNQANKHQRNKASNRAELLDTHGQRIHGQTGGVQRGRNDRPGCGFSTTQ